MTRELLIIASPAVVFAVFAAVLTAWFERSDRGRAPAPYAVPVPAPAPFPSSAIPDCPAIAGRVVDAAWMDFLSAHDLGSKP